MPARKIDLLFKAASPAQTQNAVRVRKRKVYATPNSVIFSWDMWHPVFPDQTSFDLPTSIFNHFCNKIVSAQRNIHSIQILCTLPQKWIFQMKLFVYV